MVVDTHGEIIRTCASKRDALASLEDRGDEDDINMQDVRGSRAWAEQQIRLGTSSRARITLKRINALLVANGFPEVR